MPETDMRTKGVVVSVSKKYSRMDPGSISIADRSMGLLFAPTTPATTFVVVVVVVVVVVDGGQETTLPPEAWHSWDAMALLFIGYRCGSYGDTRSWGVGAFARWR